MSRFARQLHRRQRSTVCTRNPDVTFEGELAPGKVALVTYSHDTWCPHDRSTPAESRALRRAVRQANGGDQR